MINVLLAEDEQQLNKLITTYLINEGYSVFSCLNGEDALETFNSNKIDIVLSDIMMPKLDGYNLCENIRRFNKKIPIIFLTAKDDKLSKQYSYSLGVDDYITKPFDIDELVLKINAIVRRLEIDSSREIVIGNLRMNKDEHTAYIDNEEINLTVREFNILFKLLSYPKKTFTRSSLMDEFWDYDSSATSRTVDVYMAKIREKTNRCNGFEILTVHGLGYKTVIYEK